MAEPEAPCTRRTPSSSHPHPAHSASPASPASPTSPLRLRLGLGLGLGLGLRLRQREQRATQSCWSSPPLLTASSHTQGGGTVPMVPAVSPVVIALAGVETEATTEATTGIEAVAAIEVEVEAEVQVEVEVEVEVATEAEAVRALQPMLCAE
ncbi:hypothetical protein B484DRAFT_457428 [Ochromonadaceae sp. CCMP2298]|nr:hypothetical protein B484DRAFT_457428 [Ochromonadaceae sp. CCMP2298]